MRRLAPPRRVVAALLVGLARLLVRLPGPVLVGALDLARRLLTAVGLPPDGQRALTDLAKTLRDDARGRAALREILHQSRPGELSAILEGLWIHHRGAGPARGAAPARWTARPAHPTRVVVLGGGPRAEAVAAGYEAAGGCTVERVGPEGCAGLLKKGERIGVVELVAAACPEPSAVERLVVPGLVVRLHEPAVPDGAAWERLSARARSVGGCIRLGAPLLSYPPARVAWQRIVDGEIGAVGSIRVRVVLACTPGTGLTSRELLERAAFEQSALLAWFGGPIAEVRGYAQLSDAACGGQAVFAVRFAAAGRFGGVELVCAPRPAVPRGGFPARWEVEVAGTHGILWLRAGAYYAGPPVEVRSGRRHTVIGVGAGLPTAWDAAWRLAACDALAHGARFGRYELGRDPAAVRSALEARAAMVAVIDSARRYSMALPKHPSTGAARRAKENDT